MRLNRFFFLAVVLVTNVGSTAYAAQPWDWKIGPSGDGTDANVAVFFPGAQGGIEHRRSIYGGSNQLRLALGGTCALPAFAAVQADADLRILFLQPGISVGANDTWRNYTFAPDESLSRSRRRERFASGAYDNVFWPFFEGRLMMALPFNDYVMLQTTGTVAHEGRPDRSYDWQNAIVHDGGLLYKWETNLFLHHKKFGGLAPKIQIVDFTLDGDRHTQLNYGFMLVTRAGLTRYDDVFMLQMLFTAPVFGSYDNTKVYGMDQFRLPFNFIIAYQSNIRIWTKIEE
jgi:hypothetical protein